MATASHYVATCWNCLGEFDALKAVWCSDDPKNPTKLCPFCFRCFCEASDRYKQEFWRRAPAQLREELNTLSRSKDRLGDILIRMGRMTTTQLLDALTEQKQSKARLGEILVARGVITAEDVAAALRTQGHLPLADTLGVAYAASPVWEQARPDAIIQYVLGLAAKKGASDVQIEPREDQIGVKYRIDDFFFRLDPIPRAYEEPLTRRLLELFALDPADRRAQRRRITSTVNGEPYDLVLQTLPTAHGLSATVKLVNRASFIKDMPALGLELEDRVRLLEELRGAFGLVLLTAPAFQGAATTMYSLMSFMTRGVRDVLSVETPVLWPMDGVRQVDAGTNPSGIALQEVVRSVVAVRPEVLVLSALPDSGTAHLATQLASSSLVVALTTAQSAAQAVTNMLQLGIPRPLLSGCLSAVTCQRLVRQICRICRVPADPPAPQTLALHGIPAAEAERLRFFKGRGCPSCNRVGYRGRRAIFEVLTAAPEVRTAVLNAMSTSEIEAVAVGAGMTVLRDRALELVRDGVTTFEEFVRLKLG
ncbi:MAG TPA: ATPase, T2SS/T4P/T4SS family [Vicinamibacteria bacterium]|nr:ATPase, T2SS/T4P/T4SS family [Vicinamibacteria bacterium]